MHVKKSNRNKPLYCCWYKGKHYLEILHYIPSFFFSQNIFFMKTGQYLTFKLYYIKLSATNHLISLL